MIWRRGWVVPLMVLHGYTGADGRYALLLPRDRDLPDGPVVVEAGAFGFGITVGEPFEPRPDGVINVWLWGSWNRGLDVGDPG